MDIRPRTDCTQGLCSPGTVPWWRCCILLHTCSRGCLWDGKFTYYLPWVLPGAVIVFFCAQNSINRHVSVTASTLLILRNLIIKHFDPQSDLIGFAVLHATCVGVTRHYSWGNREISKNMCWKRNYFSDRDVDGRIILKWTLICSQ
jgi:hypothetical protein